MSRALLAAALLGLVACSIPGPERPVMLPSHPDSAAGSCQAAGYRAPGVLLLAKEAVPEELDGLNYFAADWGLRQGCFHATIVTTPSGLSPARYGDLVIDVSHDSSLTAADVELARAFVAAGKRVALFGWPLRLSDLAVETTAVSGLSGLLGNFAFRSAPGCGDWQYGNPPRSPFNLDQTSYRYENFGATIFTVEATGPQRAWASTLFCDAHPGRVMVELPAGVVAGFSIAYTISLADNNVRAVAMKRLFVDVVSELAGPLPALT